MLVVEKFRIRKSGSFWNLCVFFRNDWVVVFDTFFLWPLFEAEIACRTSCKIWKFWTFASFESEGIYAVAILCVLLLHWIFLLVLFIRWLLLWQDMSAEVVDSNPYSRLMALQRMGIVQNYERIREYSVAIVVCIYLLFSYPSV